jgi:hypothetical protein
LPGKTATPDSQAEPFDVKPTLKVTSNVELDLDSLKEHVTLSPQGKRQKENVSLQVALAEDKTPSTSDQPQEQSNPNQPQEKFDPSQRNWVYTLTPQRSLEKATNYRLEFSPGLRPARGNLPTETPFVSQVTTYAPLTFNKIELNNEERFVKGSAQLKFNNGLVADSAIKNITVQPASKKTLP